MVGCEGVGCEDGDVRGWGGLSGISGLDYWIHGLEYWTGILE